MQIKSVEINSLSVILPFMCLAVPGKIEKRAEDGKTATVDFSGLKRKVNISLLKDTQVGDWVLVHVGFAIQKIDEATARETYHLLDEMGVKTEEEIGREKNSHD